MMDYCAWDLAYPLEDSVITDNTLNVRYRGTSGAGQLELAGSSMNPNGAVIKSRDVIGSSIRFEFSVTDFPSIRLAEAYPVREIGGKVRISVKSDASDDRPNIGNLLAAVLLLPEISQKGKSSPLVDGKLNSKTFWVDDVDTLYIRKDSDCVTLRPVKIILATGNKDDDEQFTGAAAFDFEKRFRQMRLILSSMVLLASDGIKAACAYYLDVIEGRKSFEYVIGSMFRSYIVSQLVNNLQDYEEGEDLLEGLSKYVPLRDQTIGLPVLNQPRNLIYFGAPGTGKSYSLNKLAEEHFDKAHTRRVTFHPDYSYASFVGCYKPTMRQPEQKSNESLSENMGRAYVSYEFVPGPLVKSYVEAKTHPNENYLLIVEEINRANPAAVFGDVFQLLDRDGDGESEYDVDVPTDLGEYLWKEFLDASSRVDEAPGLYSLEENRDTRVQSMRLPSNLYIWATMNSADQGVFPMDTAFKRRWEFRYMGIDEGEAKIAGKVVRLGIRREPVEWNALRHAVNGLLKTGAHVNEDKLLGPFFLKKSALEDDDAFDEAFKSKVLLYLYEDAAKMKRPKVFRHPDFTYSEICAEYDSSADGVFVLDEPVPRVEDDAASDDEGNGQGAEE